MKLLRCSQSGVSIPFVRLKSYSLVQHFKSSPQYASCLLLQFFTAQRDWHSAPISASTRQKRLVAAFRLTTFTAILTAIALFGSMTRAQSAGSVSLAPTPSRTPARSYFINASGSLGDGSGSSAANAADASTAAKYDAINQAQNVSGTTIVYAPGTYLTNGGNSMFNNVTHQGAGIDSTFIQLADFAKTFTGQRMWWCNGASTISHFKVSDLTINFNATNQTWWSAGTGSSEAFLFTTADHCTVQRVKFINMGAKNQESFPIVFNDGLGAAGNANNNLVDSCIFTQPITSGNTNGGLTCVNMTDYNIGSPGQVTVDNTNVVSDCQFLNLRYPRYSDLNYTQCVTCPVAINNSATNVDSFWYVEPGSQSAGNQRHFLHQTCHVTGNTLVNSGQIAFINCDTANAGAFGNLNVENNTIGMGQNPYGFYGSGSPLGVKISVYSSSGTSEIGTIAVHNNTFSSTQPELCAIALSANDRSGGAPGYFHIASLSFIDNTLINFAHDGTEFNVDPTHITSYTNTGNTYITSQGTQFSSKHISDN